MKNDRNVLKFNVKADNPYIIHYYLADDTIDIREVIFPNSGRDPFPLMLKRYFIFIKINKIGRSYIKSLALTNLVRSTKKIILLLKTFNQMDIWPFMEKNS